MLPLLFVPSGFAWFCGTCNPPAGLSERVRKVKSALPPAVLRARHANVNAVVSDQINFDDYLVYRDLA